MIQRIGRVKYNIFAFDIESHNDEESIAKQETSMWLGCLINEESKPNDEQSYIYNMDEFLDRLNFLTNAKGRYDKNRHKPILNVCIFVYNLSFEWSFLFPYLLKRGFKYKEKIEKDDEMVFNSISTRSVSSVWNAQIKFGKKSGIVLFKDLGKIFQGGLGRVAKSFGLETQKGEIDYRKNRLHNYVIPQYEKEYCFNDCKIIVEILCKMQEKGDRAFWKCNSASSYAMMKLLKVGYRKYMKPYKAFREEYPKLDEKENDFLRKGVEGGITYANPLFQYKEIKHKILHIDLHQAHPSSAYYNLFPYGKGEYFEGVPPYDTRWTQIACCRVKISYSSVKLHSVIKLIGLPMIDDAEITCWDFELEIMKKCYNNLKIKFIDGYMYKAKRLRWRKFYEINYNMREEAKKKGDKFGEVIYKLWNNGSYGKLLEKAHNELIINILDRDGVITSILQPKDEQDCNAKYTYLPVGSCIPAYTRCKLVGDALKFGYKNIIYFDTDSIFMIYNSDTWKTWKSNQIDKQNHLGGWGLEEIAEKGEFACAKRYKLYSGGKSVVKMGGINFDREVSFDELNIDFNKFQVRRAYRVKGGTIIDFQEKEISVAKKFEGIYKMNKKK